jgi:hypothetical protein
MSGGEENDRIYKKKLKMKLIIFEKEHFVGLY